MPYTPQTFSNGDTDYISRHNTNNSNIAALLNVALQDIVALKAAVSVGSDLDFRLIATNILINGGFDWWQRGTSWNGTDTYGPDLWAVVKVGATLTVQRSTAQVDIGTYSAKVVGRGRLEQTLPEEFRSTLDTTFQISFAANVYTDTASHARIGIYTDGVTQWADDYHTGGSSWEQQRVSYTQGSGSVPAVIKFVLSAEAEATVYWNGGVVIYGNPNASPFYIPINKTLEELYIMGSLEYGQCSVAGVGCVSGSDRILQYPVGFVAPKRSTPTVSFIAGDETGYELTALDVTRNGFTLQAKELGDVSGTDGFDIPGIEWKAEI